MLSIVIPTLDEAATVRATLESLAPIRADGAEVIVADGASRDGTAALATPLADQVLTTSRGRAVQMNAGAHAAQGDILLFLHADTRLPNGADALVRDALADSSRTWGRFDVRIEPARPVLRVVAGLMNLRSRWTGIATGDQAIFVRRATFEAAGGFPDIPLMEDIALSRALKRTGPPVCLRTKVVTSGRRWMERGPLRTILLMWRLRLAYYFGADPRELAVRYGYSRRD